MTAPVYQHLTSSNGVVQRCCWTRWNRPPSAVFGSVVALLVGTAILIAACVSQSHASGLAQIADIDDVMQQQMESLRSKISSAFVGLTTASQALGGTNSFSYAAFYQVARHLAGQGYVSGHVSLLEYVTSDQRPAVEARCNALWNRTDAVVQQYNASNTVNPLQLVPAPNRSQYAVYTSVFDLDDPALHDLGCFDLLSIPLRAAAWNTSVTKNRLILTAPTRRLVCAQASCDKVFLVLTPIFSPVQSWRLRESYLEYWRAPDPAYHSLLGHLVTVYDFQSELKLSTQGFAGAFALEDITDTTDGKLAIAVSDAEALAAPSINGTEYNPLNPLHLQAAAVRRDTGDFQPSNPSLFGRRAGSSFLYAFSNGWDSGSVDSAPVQITADTFESYRASGEWGGSTLSKLIVVGGRVFALHAAVSPAAVTHVDTPVVIIAVCGSVVVVLVALLTYFWMRHLYKEREATVQTAASQAERLNLAAKVHNFLMAYLADQARNPIHGLLMTINDLRASLLRIEDGLSEALEIPNGEATPDTVGGSVHSERAVEPAATAQSHPSVRTTGLGGVRADGLTVSDHTVNSTQQAVAEATASSAEDVGASALPIDRRAMRSELQHAFDGLKLLSNCTTRLHVLHDDFSDFSLISMGELKLKLSVIEVVDFVQTVVASQRGFTSQSVRFAIDPATPNTITCDLMRLQQVVSIGLSNASKHSLPGQAAAIVFKVFPVTASFGGAVCFRIANYSNGLSSTGRTTSALFMPKAIYNAIKSTEPAESSITIDTNYAQASSSELADAGASSIAAKANKNGGFGLPLAKLICSNLKCGIAVYDVNGLTLDTLSLSSRSPADQSALLRLQRQDQQLQSASNDLEGIAALADRTITCFDVIVPKDMTVVQLQHRSHTGGDARDTDNHVYLENLLSTVGSDAHLFLDGPRNSPADVDQPASLLHVASTPRRSLRARRSAASHTSMGLGMGLTAIRPARQAGTDAHALQVTTASTQLVTHSVHDHDDRAVTWHSEAQPMPEAADSGHAGATNTAQCPVVAVATMGPEAPASCRIPGPVVLSPISCTHRLTAGEPSPWSGRSSLVAASPNVALTSAYTRRGVHIRFPGTGAALSMSEESIEMENQAGGGSRDVVAGDTSILVRPATAQAAATFQGNVYAESGEVQRAATVDAAILGPQLALGASSSARLTSTNSVKARSRSVMQTSTPVAQPVDQHSFAAVSAASAVGLRSSASITPDSRTRRNLNDADLLPDQLLPGSVQSALPPQALHADLLPSPTSNSIADFRLAARPSEFSTTSSVPLPQRDGRVYLGLRVLYADDDAVNRKLMTRTMKSIGCSILALEDGDEVEAALDADAAQCAVTGRPPYDVILLDIVMKRMGGDTVCRKLVRERKIPQPVIAVTGNARDVSQLRSAGFVEIVEKPFKTKDVIAAITNHVMPR